MYEFGSIIKYSRKRFNLEIKCVIFFRRVFKLNIPTFGERFSRKNREPRKLRSTHAHNHKAATPVRGKKGNKIGKTLFQTPYFMRKFNGLYVGKCLSIGGARSPPLNIAKSAERMPKHVPRYGILPPFHEHTYRKVYGRLCTLYTRMGMWPVCTAACRIKLNAGAEKRP